MNTPSARPIALFGIFAIVLLSSGRVAVGQEESGERPDASLTQSELTEILQKLRMPYTDWFLWRDTCDRVRAGGEETIRGVLEVIDSVEDPEDAAQAKYRVRLARVLAEIDPDRGLPLLAELCVSKHADVAAFAARALGRTRARSEEVAEHLMDALEVETRAAPRLALLVAMGECGESSLFVYLEILLNEGEFSGWEAHWAQYSLALLAPPIDAPKVREWIGTGDGTLSMAGILIAKKYRDLESTGNLIRIARQEDHRLRAEAVHALAAIGGPEARNALVPMAEALDARTSPKLGEPVMRTTRAEPLFMAMLRLYHPIGLRWATSKIAATSMLVGPEVSRIAELAWAWHGEKSSPMLETWIRNENLPDMVKVSLGRGLCRIGDTRGIEILTSVLLNGGGVLEEVPSAQQALHGFVSNLDRPEYFVLKRPYPTSFDLELARRLGHQWEEWLAKNRDHVQWRRTWELSDESSVEWFLFR